jgi:superfamily II DNA or RNA helicase
MVKLEDIKKDAQLRGIEPEEIVRIITVEPVGANAVTVYYKTNQGRLGEQMLFRSDETRLSLAAAGRPWSFDAPGGDFKLALEAYRISMAHLFDPMMAIHTSNVEPLPHQISAVYEAMLPRQPLRFILADDPGAGKTIMAGLYIRELMMRADAKRILIVSPGSLTEQWQDELQEKFGTSFDLFSREKQEQCVTGNYFEEQERVICRLDQLSRNEHYQELLKATRWDLIIVDEAHKLSASYFGNKINKTKRFLLGELLGSLTRHFLLMTATPHNGKEEDFQLFLSLLDGDRFYGKFRDGAQKVDVSDIMRRMVKEKLLRFDGTRLFPERRAYTANYDLSPAENALYEDVTDYVRNEMNRAERLLDAQRKGRVGFALTLLQRRLASSPAAIHQSLRRRQEKLEKRLEEMTQLSRGNLVREDQAEYIVRKRLDVPEDLDDAEEELTGEEYENWVDQVVDQATAAESIPELMAEIEILKGLKRKAHELVQSQSDRKWDELRSIMLDNPETKTPEGKRRKLIIFTEHKDTLNYLRERISGVLGNPEAVDVIHGGVNRDERRKVQERFRNHDDLLVLIATDAAGEGVNLQNANLMINYDLPWNPNRLEQRFGRIHRIGQREVCHLWNLVASGTREGDVFQRLFDKIEVERLALGGQVFDILGEAFENHSLKQLLVEAIRYGESPETKAKMQEVIDGALDTDHIKEILKRNALVEQNIGLEELFVVKEQMERAEARKLQPYFIRAFFGEAFTHLGGEIRPRETARYEVRHVPAAIRERDRLIGTGRTPVLRKYERICFEKEQVSPPGSPMADLVHPAHPLMAAVTDLVLEAHRPKLKQGAVLLDPNDDSTEPHVLFMIDHSVRESSGDTQRIASRRLQFVSIDQHGKATHAGWAPHLDLQPIGSSDLKMVPDVVNAPWITGDLDALAVDYASQKLVPEHYDEVRGRHERQADKILVAVQERLIKEISYQSDLYIKLSGSSPTGSAGSTRKANAANARRTAEELTARLEQRKRELQVMKNVVSCTPVIVGGALVIPQGLLDQRSGKETFCVDAAARARVEQVAMNAVMDHERGLGYAVTDVSADKCGWDVTGQPPMVDGKLVEPRHIEVKGRAKGQTTITVSRNEIIYALNQADKFILAIVIVDGETFEGPYYIRNPFTQEPDFSVASINYDLGDLLEKAE